MGKILGLWFSVYRVPGDLANMRAFLPYLPDEEVPLASVLLDTLFHSFAYLSELCLFLCPAPAFFF